MLFGEFSAILWLIRMVFFSTDNPILLLLVGVVVFLVLRAVLSKVLKKSKFGQKHSDFVSAIIAVLTLLMVTSISFLKIVANIIPWITLTFILVLLAVLVYSGFGTDPERSLKH